MVEMYIDDMVVKSKKSKEHVPDLVDVFEILRHHRLWLNVAKCAFGVGSGKVLGYMIMCWGIKVNLDQISAIQQLKLPRNSKEVQKLIGMIATLNRFVSKSADKCCSFFSAAKEVEGILVD